MKILMVSMVSLHYFRWTEQLRNSGHELYWFDVLDGGEKIERLDFVYQRVGWRQKWNFPGRFFFKKHLLLLYKWIEIINTKSTEKSFEKFLIEVKPDVVHSFVLYMSCYPILNVMKRNPNIKWIYSAWGNDLFFYRKDNVRLKEIMETLPYLDYMFADCTRDFHIAKELGFKGEYLGTFPTGGGYDLDEYLPYLKVLEKRKIILIKGYQHKFGRVNNVLEAITRLKKQLKEYQIVVYADNQQVRTKVVELGLNKWDNFSTLGRVNHKELLKVKGASLIYIGNSTSDGTPNTLLEAMIMGAFPIQSNPGGATAEWINHKKNGLLLEDPEDAGAIAEEIAYAIENPAMLKDGISYNTNNILPILEREYVGRKVLRAYKKIEQSL
jgi:glycosyltransferase involved in cell wall biosynthesis